MEFAVPFVFNGVLVGLDFFIVEELQINSVSTFLEARHDVIVSKEAMTVMLGLELLH